ncbi:MAG: sugar ABC transporter permease [Treponema sp.]
MNTIPNRQLKKGWYYRLSFPQKTAVWGLVFIAPWLIGFVLFFAVPFFQVLLYSVHTVAVNPNGGLNLDFLGFENFRIALAVDPNFNKDLVTTCIKVILYTPLVIIFSLLCAILANGDFFGRTFVRSVFFIPIIMATGLLMKRVSNLSVQMMSDPSQSSGLYGAEMIAELLFNISGSEAVVGYIISAVGNIFEIVSLSGIQILIFLGALQGIPPALYEVAKIEGATGYETFWKVTVAMLSPMILTCTVYTLADLFMRADIIETISVIAFKQSKYGLSAAMSCVYLAVNIVVILIFMGFLRKAVFYHE